MKHPFFLKLIFLIAMHYALNGDCFHFRLPLNHDGILCLNPYYNKLPIGILQAHNLLYSDIII